MHVLRCVKCGTVYDTRIESEWGRNRESNGNGPAARCVALVPAPYAPRTQSGEVASQVCAGSLSAEHLADESVEVAGRIIPQPITAR